MAEIPDCLLRNLKIDVVKRKFQFTVTAEFAELEDVIDDVDELRRLAFLEDGVVVTVQPFVKQLSLYGSERRERPADTSFSEPVDWQPRDASDRPTGTTLDGFLSGEES